MKKSTIKKLDKVWSEKIREKGYCEFCKSKVAWLNAAHIVGRRYRWTRWGAWIDGKYDLCGMCLCYTCHNHYDEHGYNESDIRLKVVGEERYNKIRFEAKAKVADNQDYEEIKRWIEKGE